jgi:hypothetical protein
MKAKLTLHLDDDVKARAEAFAQAQGTSVVALVEDYLQRLARAADAAAARPPTPDAPMPDAPMPDDGDRAGDLPLTPRIRALRPRLGQPAPPPTLDADTRRWVEAAARKHR